MGRTGQNKPWVPVYGEASCGGKFKWGNNFELCIAEGDDELDVEIDLRAKRQREALVCVRPGDESEFLKIKQHQKYTVSTTQKFFQKNL